MQGAPGFSFSFSPSMKLIPQLSLALLSSLLLLNLVSCAITSQMTLDYVPSPGHVRPGQAEFATQLFTDRRNMEPYDLGTIRTQIGTPLEHLQTRKPIADMVTNAVGYALESRGMLTAATKARYVITGDILELYCKQVVAPYAYAQLRVNVVNADTGRILHTGTYTGERQAQLYVPGSGSPVNTLEALTSGALQDAVDRALDDPDFRSNL
jgi:hypothetical protein